MAERSRSFSTSPSCSARALLTARALGRSAPRRQARPSAYSAGATRNRSAPAAPQSGCARLLFEPSSARMPTAIRSRRFEHFGAERRDDVLLACGAALREAWFQKREVSIRCDADMECLLKESCETSGAPCSASGEPRNREMRAHRLRIPAAARGGASLAIASWQIRGWPQEASDTPRLRLQYSAARDQCKAIIAASKDYFRQGPRAEEVKQTPGLSGATHREEKLSW